MRTIPPLSRLRKSLHDFLVGGKLFSSDLRSTLLQKSNETNHRFVFPCAFVLMNLTAGVFLQCKMQSFYAIEDRNSSFLLENKKDI